MEMSKEDLRKNYESSSSGELLELKKSGGLTELANSVLEEEISKRGEKAEHHLETRQQRFEFDTDFKMKKHTKIFLGILTCLPFIFLMVIILLMASVGIRDFFQYIQNYNLVKFSIAFYNLIAFVFIILYIGFIIKDNSMKMKKKALWIILILSSGVITMPIFWYLYIWKNEKTDDLKLK